MPRCNICGCEITNEDEEMDELCDDCRVVYNNPELIKSME